MNNNNDDLNKYLATQYNLMDHLTKRVYGEDTTYDQLSPFGQQHIESLARLQPLSVSPDPEVLRIREENALLREENLSLMDRVASLMRDVEELYNDLEEQEGNEA